MSFLSTAGKRTGDIRAFLREAAGSNTIKYKPSRGQKDIIYIPYMTVEVPDGNGGVTYQKELVALSMAIHEWTDNAGKYKATACLQDVVRKADDGTLINDGTCPFCNNVGKAWDIYRYRYEHEQLTCGKVGPELEKHMESVKKTFADGRKAKDAKEYLYLLVARYRTAEGKSGNPVMGANNLPEFDLKVMKLSASRIEKILSQVENAGNEFVGSEIVFDYPDDSDPRLVVSQSTTAPVFETRQMVNIYPGLREAIQAEVDKFNWDGIEKSFPELSGMTSTAAAKEIDDLFHAWDEYQQELLVNPNALYLEYVGTTNNPSTPSLNPAAQLPPTMPGATTMPGAMPGAATMPGATPGAMPGAAPQVQMPNMMGGMPLDANSMFAGLSGGTPGAAPEQAQGQAPLGAGGINI